MKFKYGYGKGYKEFDVDEKNIIMEIRQREIDIGQTGFDEVRRALRNPIGTERLCEIVKPGEKTVIVTSDITRPMPSRVVLPAIIDELLAAGLSYDDITVVFAIGNHRKQTEEEKRYLVGEDIYRKVRCIDSDPDDCIHMGNTERGTPVDVFREVAQADRRICVGNIEFHYFAGYSGGMKAIMPGVSTREAIQANHKMMVCNEAKAGAIDDNPVRLDIEEVAKYVPVDFILNVVLDEKKNIVKAVAGHHSYAHREGCRFLDGMYKVDIPRQAEIVVTTPGGYPKDINLYQAQKALDNAKNAVKEGGIIIFLASCSEGLGDDMFEKWMLGASSPDELIERIEHKFELGGHKAAAIALVLKKSRIYFVSDFGGPLVERFFMKPFNDVNEALKEAFNEMGHDAGVILMPYGSTTLPVIRKPAG